SHGSRQFAADVGGWLTPNFGLRVNAAHEDMRSYVEHADGQRDLLALAADWKLGPDAQVQFDGNWQSGAQRSASGYQLLGGRVLPEAVDRSRMPGYQPWQRPVNIDAVNLATRLDLRLADTWNAR